MLAPSNDTELRAALRYALEVEGPVAIRYPRGSAPVAEQPAKDWQDGEALCVRKGADGALLAVGRMVEIAQKVADIVEKDGRKLAVWDMRFVKPIDRAAVVEASKTGHVFTLEDSASVGGFGSGVLETLADEGIMCPVKRFGLPDSFVTQGSTEELFKSIGLDAPAIARDVLDSIA